MQTTLIGIEQNSSMQQMGETREPMARDCWNDAHDIAWRYDKTMKRDFWVMYAAKPHTQNSRAIVAGWEVVIRRPPRGMVGVMVFKWSHDRQVLSVEPDLCLPYDVPISEAEMSRNKEDLLPSLAIAAQKSKSILLA